MALISHKDCNMRIVISALSLRRYDMCVRTAIALMPANALMSMLLSNDFPGVKLH